MGLGIQQRVEYKKIKYILVKVKENIYCELIAKDLNTNKKYLSKLPLWEGKLFVPLQKMIPVAAIYSDAKLNLPKKKILEMGNYAIQSLKKMTKKRNK